MRSFAKMAQDDIGRMVMLSETKHLCLNNLTFWWSLRFSVILNEAKSLPKLF